MSEVETLHLSDKASTDRFMFKQSFGPLLSPPERACISTAGNTEKLRKMAVHARIFHSNVRHAVVSALITVVSVASL